MYQRKFAVIAVLLLWGFLVVSCDDMFMGSVSKSGLKDMRSGDDTETPDIDDDVYEYDIDDIDVDDIDVDDIDVDEIPDADEIYDDIDTYIDSSPSGAVSDDTVVIVFSSNYYGADFECSLNYEDWAECDSPMTYENLDDGEYLFKVRASFAGYTDETPASAEWVVDLTPPVLTLDSTPPELTKETDAEFKFTINEEDAVANARINELPWESVSSPLFYSELDDGVHVFEIFAEDMVGNSMPYPIMFQWMIDTVPPETEILHGPQKLSGFTEAEFIFVCNESSCSFQCRLNNGDFDLCSSPHSLDSLESGEHTFYVKATDSAGNEENNPTEYQWTVDESIIDTYITSKPNYYSNKNAAVFNFISNVTDADFVCSLNSTNDYEGCSPPYSLHSLPDGAHTFYVRAISSGGMQDDTPAVYNWYVDTGMPDTVITNKPAEFTESTNARFEFSSDYDEVVFECRLNNSVWKDCYSPKIYSELSEGSHSFSVRATNRYGTTDIYPPEYSWTVGSDQDGDDDDEFPDEDTPVSCESNSDCNDDILCTVDICDENGECRNFPDHSVCTAGKICDTSLGCVAAEDRLCRNCAGGEGCGDTSDICSNVGPDRLCLIPCEHEGLCPEGFTCSDILDDDNQELGKACYPDSGICCLDIDDDGAGIGYQCIAYDCDETDPEVYEGAEEICNNKDNSCDGVVDTPWTSVDKEGLCNPAVENCKSEVCHEGVGRCMDTGIYICDPENPSGPLICSAEAGEPEDEVCDNTDNNCDGIIDNHPDGLWDDKNEMCEVGVGQCYRKGLKICDPDNPTGATICSVELGTPQPEQCNGKDDDCDGVIDNGLDTAPCPLQEGVCAGAERECMHDLGWSTCGKAEYGDGYEKDIETLCDGLDNNCDGVVDNITDEYRPMCPIQQGVCAGTRKRCHEGEWAECTAEDYGDEYDGEVEVTCSGKDNNCDGDIDNIPWEHRPFCPNQEGVCEGARTVCEDGAPKECGPSEYFDNNNQYEAVETKCDGLDNNCDGTVDNVAWEHRPLCENQAGVCAGARKKCRDGEWLPCSSEEYLENNENYEEGAFEQTCNGLDNNCDGIDDNMADDAKPLCSKQDGVCGGSLQECVNGSWEDCNDTDYSNHNSEYESGEETECDNLDNNCDGLVDNIKDETQPLCANQNGVCSGARRGCVAGEWQDSCTDETYALYNPAYEAGEETSCDGLDNNCDGIDDNIDDDAKPLCSKQDGVCSGARQKCQESTWNDCTDSDYINHNDAYEPGAYETKCDNLDNNCDGTVDNIASDKRSLCEIQTGVCSGAMKKCIAGSWQDECTSDEYHENSDYYEEGIETSCDGLDNNCDGFSDNIPKEHRQPCAKIEGVCEGSKKLCIDGSWLECTDNDYLNHNPLYDGSVEKRCDGYDNSCDGIVDNVDPAYRLPCGNQNGVCSGSLRRCSDGEWLDCTFIEYSENSSYYEEDEELSCDGIDNNCDGVVDNIADSARPPCSKNQGVCSGALKTCAAGTWVDCTHSDYLNHNPAYEIGEEEKCDNLDNNCDGIIDNIPDEKRLPCPNQAGVCNGSLRECTAGIWQECTNDTYLEYNPDYESGEETLCDGIDNNCDGFIDNIALENRQLCDNQKGVCEGSRKPCIGGSWQECDDSYMMTYTLDYEAGLETRCDGLDNNCDGQVDENLKDSDINNCGECGNVCPFANHVIPECVNGVCMPEKCEEGWNDRNGDLDFDKPLSEQPESDGCEYACSVYSEVDDTFYVCDEDGFYALSEISEELPGENCDEGGVRIDSGIDDGSGGGQAD
ncbi:MAG: putative metal-binding motif-containing protein, partial [bacterium]